MNKNFINFLFFVLILFFIIINLNLPEQTNGYPDKGFILNTDSITPLCNGVNFSELSQMNKEDIQNINIDIPRSADWYRNFFNAYLHATEKGNFINDIFKNKFKATVEINYINGLSCNYISEIRINGDLKDHLDINNLVSSLDVKLEEGNIFGITRFKLFIPKTRNGDNEVFTANLLSHLNFLSPRTFYVEASINKNNPYKYIFQEKISKEMLEHNGYREGPLLEVNEEYVWNTSGDLFFREDAKFTKPPVEFARVINENWANRTTENKIISLEGIEKLNKSLFSTLNNNQINNEILSGVTKHIYMFEAANRALVANHGVAINHNRQLFFDKLSNQFIPSYYDGSPEFFDLPPRQPFIYAKPKKLALGAQNVLNLDINVEELLNELNNSGLSYTEVEINTYIKNFRNNLNKIIEYETQDNLDHPLLEEEISNRRDVDLYFLLSDLETGVNKICNQKLENCKDVDLTNEVNIFESNLYYDEKPMYTFGIKRENFISSLKSNIDKPDYEDIKIDNFFVRNFSNSKIRTDFEKKEIYFILENIEQKVLIYSDETIKNWSFYLDDKNIEKLKTRTDKNLLTGCLTFYRTFISNVNISVNNSHCEDGLNLINVEGSFNNIDISNATFDALDLDFSNVVINNVYIKKAGNDCLDVSSGNYLFSNLDLNDCLDKSISIGEKSIIEIKYIKTSSSGKGVVVKDSSLALINEFNGYKIDRCVEMYRKKQEFGPSKLAISKYMCEGNEENFIQIGSEYDEN